MLRYAFCFVMPLFILSCTKNTCPAIDTILQKRDPDLFLESMKMTLNLISMQENVIPVGSAAYSSQTYPGDVDLFEIVRLDKNKQEAMQAFADEIKKIAQQIQLSNTVFFSDFKAGFDQRLNIDIGSSASFGAFTGYDGPTVRAAINALVNQTLLTSQEGNALLALAVDSPTFTQWSALKEDIRQLYTLRWTLDELIAQQKTLRGNVLLNLADALDNTAVKLDVVAPVTINGYTEVSDFYSLRYTDNGQEVELTSPLGDYAEGIRNDILTYSNAILGRNSLKAAKRMWAFAVNQQDYALVLKLTTLLQGDAAALNQVLSQADAIALIMSVKPVIFCPAGVALASQIEGFEKRVTLHSDLVAGDLNAIFDPVYDAITTNCPKDNPTIDEVVLDTPSRIAITTALSSLSTLVKPIIEQKAAAFLTSVGIDLERPLDAFTGQVAVCPVN